jgi:hypothetical protein
MKRLCRLAARMTLLQVAVALGIVLPGLEAAGARGPEAAAIPAQLSATVVIEPPRIEIGDPFQVEIAVVTPPDHAVSPAPVPKATPGLWILDAERPSVERQPGRWIHRQRFRARARATGPFTWPALEIGVAAPDGEKRVVQVPERPFVVSSLLDAHPEQRGFFSYRAPRLEAAGERGPWLPALLGALLALGGVALFSWVRRARLAAAAAAQALAAAPAAVDAAAAAREALRRAAGHADPVRAADLASVALRDWAAERARTPALRAATAEELAARPPPFLLATRWPAFVAALHEFDALRFPPRAPDAAARVRDAIARASDRIGGSAS